MTGFNPISDGALGDYGSDQTGVVLKYVYADSLLPANATKQEKDLELSGARLSDIDHPLRHLFDADKCPENLLPWLAWSLSVDEWQSDWPEERKREAIRSSIIVHAKKGTVGSIRQVLRNAGYGEVTITEGRTGIKYDGTGKYDGTYKYNAGGHWADYSVFLTKRLTIAEANFLRKLLANTAPARCKLVELNFTAATYRYNGEIKYDGTHTYGSG